MLQWTLGYKCLFELWFSQGTCPVVGLLGHMVVLFLVFKEISISFSAVAVSIYIATNCARRSPFLHIFSSTCLQIFWWWSFEVISCCSFDSHFSNNEQCWASVQVFVSHLYVLWRNVYLVLWPIFWLGCLFFWNWAVGVACIFLRLIICQLLHLLLFSPILKAVFSPC